MLFTREMLARRLVPAVRRALPLAVRGMAKKAESNVLSHSEITKVFLEMDAAAGAAAVSDLPIKLSGRSGELVEQLYGKNKKNFDKAVKELEVNFGCSRGAWKTHGEV